MNSGLDGRDVAPREAHHRGILWRAVVAVTVIVVAWPIAVAIAGAGAHVHGAEGAGSTAWFTNYGHYMPRIHCLQTADGSPDWPWIWFLIGTAATVVAGYLRIYFFWLKCYFAERPENRNRKLWQLANVFLLCASTGYVLSIVMFFWPAYRLMALVFVVLIVVTLRFLRDLEPLELTFSAVRLLRERDAAQAELSRRNRAMRDLLDHVDQGFLTVDVDGWLGLERSRVVDAWFGTPDPSERFWEYIARTDPTFAAWIELSWEALGDDVFPLEVTLAQMPRRLSANGRDYEFEYSPIYTDDRISNLLLIVTDSTERNQRQRSEAQQRELTQVFGHWLRDRRGTQEFFTEATRLVEEISAAAGDEQAADLRAIHTLKGICAGYGLQSLAEHCHALESDLHDSGRELEDADRHALCARWAVVASPIGALFGETNPSVLEVGGAEYDGLRDAIVRRVPHSELLARIDAWRFEPTRLILGRFADRARALASRLGKGKLEVRVTSNGLRLPPERWAPLWTAFIHVVRNAVDHGIECALEREERGKGGPQLELATHVDAGHLVVSVHDDGGGVDWERVRIKAAEQGLVAETDAHLQAAMFAVGFTTRESTTEISGRGVGLAAVADAVHELDGRIEVESQLGIGTTVRFVFPLEDGTYAVEAEMASAGDSCGAR